MSLATVITGNPHGDLVPELRTDGDTMMALRRMLLCMLVILGGCSSQAGLTGLKDDTIHLRAQLQVLQDRIAIRADVDSLHAHISRLEALAHEQMDLIWNMRADLNHRISGLDDHIQILEAKIAESERLFSRLSQKMEGVKAQLGTAPRADSLNISAVDPEDLYNLALTDYQRGNYELAIRQFRQYLEYFPNSELADDAQYYIGDCYYTQSQYTQALDSYEGLLDKYPRGNKVPTTLLKIAFTKIAQKDNRAARTFLNRVIETYPNTEEAKLAQMRLELMPEQ